MLQCNKTYSTWSNRGTFLLFLSSSITGPSPNNFWVYLVHNSNLYPVLISEFNLFLTPSVYIKIGDTSLVFIVGSFFWIIFLKIILNI